MRDYLRLLESLIGVDENNNKFWSAFDELSFLSVKVYYIGQLWCSSMLKLGMNDLRLTELISRLHFCHA